MEAGAVFLCIPPSLPGRPPVLWLEPSTVELAKLRKSHSCLDHRERKASPGGFEILPSGRNVDTVWVP